MLAALAALSWLCIAAWIVSVALLLVGSLRDASLFVDTLGNPLASAPAVVFWTSITVAFVITALRTVYQRAALRTKVRGRRLAATTFFISQGVWIAAYVALLEINVLAHHFAAAAVFGILGAGLFTALKLMATKLIF